MYSYDQKAVNDSVDISDHIAALREPARSICLALIMRGDGIRETAKKLKMKEDAVRSIAVHAMAPVAKEYDIQINNIIDRLSYDANGDLKIVADGNDGHVMGVEGGGSISIPDGGASIPTGGMGIPLGGIGTTEKSLEALTAGEVVAKPDTLSFTKPTRAPRGSIEKKRRKNDNRRAKK